jgi:hypothetical protein
MASPKETSIDTRTVAGRTVTIVRLDWPDGGVLYDVYQQISGGLELLTSDESLDHIPADFFVGPNNDGATSLELVPRTSARRASPT